VRALRAVVFAATAGSTTRLCSTFVASERSWRAVSRSSWSVPRRCSSAVSVELRLVTKSSRSVSGSDSFWSTSFWFLVAMSKRLSIAASSCSSAAIWSFSVVTFSST
jgi:hypothetical protein